MTGKTNTILLWVGIVTNKYGANTYVAVSEDALRDELFEYVKAWWPEEIADLPLPLDRDQAIEVYFEKVESETCVIDSAALAGDFEHLFRPLPNDKIRSAYGSTRLTTGLEVGERDALLDACPWEEHLELRLGPDGQVWTKVGPVEDIPEVDQ